ncbi:MAG: hypothetical protein KDK12_05335 [Rhodobacteraceae bacterium]|nr:hypothetical protein [Paracoccaceae bacterium]
MAPPPPLTPPLDASTVPGRGAAALIALSLLAGLAAMVPVRGDLLGLMTGIGGALAVAIVLPHPERRPLLALSWGALAFALPVALVLIRPGLPLGMSLTAGAAGLWTILGLAACRALPDR